MQSELDKYLEVFLGPGNPVFVPVLITLLIAFMLFFVFRYIIFPLQKKHKNVTSQLKLKNARLMALFTEINPDPVIRINQSGVIISSNDAAINILSLRTLEGLHISQILPEFNKNITGFIREVNSTRLLKQIGSKHFSVYCISVPSFYFVQFYFHDITERVEHERQIEKSRNSLRLLSNRLQESIETERSRIAREIHDGVGQNLLILKLLLNAEVSALNLPPEKLTKFKEILYIQDRTVKEIRDVIKNLKPRLLEEKGCRAALSAIIEQVSAGTGIKGKFEYNGIEERFNPDLELLIFRTVQEALNNIVKHAGADEFKVIFNNFDNTILLSVEDNGSGFDISIIDEASGMGLLNMRERIDYYNGTFNVAAAEPAGTVITVELPKNVHKNETVNV